MIGSFGEIIFEISDKKVLSIENEINRTYKSKTSEHNPIYGPGKIRHQGRELIDISFSIKLNTTLTPDIQTEIQKIKEVWEKGEFNFLVFGGQTFGEYPFVILDISEKNQYYNRSTGMFDYVELELNLKEYIEDLNTYNKQLEAKKINKIETTTEEISMVETEQKEVVT